MMQFLVIGTILGLSAGFAPGPLLTLVVSETLQHGIKSGVKIALAPIITDTPIVILTFLVLSKLAQFHTILGIISCVGGVFILCLGFQHIQTKDVQLNLQKIQVKSLSKGILTNILSPHPYLFWLSVGAPTMTKAATLGPQAPFAFLISFYIFLVGSKVILAFAVGQSRSFLRGKAYVLIIRLLGGLLCLLALFLFLDGLRLLEIL